MMALTQAGYSPAVLLAMVAVTGAGSAGLVAALRFRGWTPVRDARRRLSRRR